MDHFAAMRQDSAFSIFSVGNMQRVAAPESISGHNKGVSIVVSNTSKTIQRSSCPSPTRSYRGSVLMSAEQFEVWRIQGQTLRNMTHCDLMQWLEDSGFTEEVTTHFRKYRIDGRKLWSNVRNASMFLYNVGVVQPTLRDAIIQNIYLELVPQTSDFVERQMSDFKRLEVIALGPISTVYKAVISKGRERKMVIIKGYHFDADQVRVGKIIQILVHMVIHVDSPRFVKMLGFIRNMMTMDDDDVSSRPMFGVVMEYCDGG